MYKITDNKGTCIKIEFDMCNEEQGKYRKIRVAGCQALPSPPGDHKFGASSLKPLFLASGLGFRQRATYWAQSRRSCRLRNGRRRKPASNKPKVMIAI